MLHVPVTVHPRHLGAGAHGDVRDVGYLLDEVVRHRGLERRGAHQHGHRAGVLGQVDGCLPGRVRAAHHVHLLVLAAFGLGERGAVVDAHPGHLGAAGRVELPVGDAGGQDDRLGVDRGAVAEPDGPGLAVHLEGGHLGGGDQLGAELDRLPPRPVRELPAGQAVREAQVVLDPGGLARLAAGRVLLDEHGAQPLGRAVDRRAEPGRAAAHHHEVVELAFRYGRQADLRRDLGMGRLD